MALGRDDLKQILQLLNPLRTRVANMVARGVVQLVDEAKKLQMLQLGVLDGEDVPDCEHFQPYGFASVPLEGAEAVVLFPNGDHGHPLVVATSDRRYRPTGGERGQVTLYHYTGAKVTFLKDGDIDLTPAPGREVFIRTEGGDAEPVVKQSEFLKHTHVTAGTGPPTPPTKITPGQEAPAATWPGTTVLKVE